MALPHMAHPRREDDGQAGAVGDLRVDGRHLMLHAVAGPIAVAHAGDAQATAGQAVVRERADPHELGARVESCGSSITMRAASIAARTSPQAMLSVTPTAGSPEKKRSMTWAIMSVTPAAVW